MNLNDDVIDRCRRIGSLHQRHPGRPRGLVRHHNRLHPGLPVSLAQYLARRRASTPDPPRRADGHLIVAYDFGYTPPDETTSSGGHSSSGSEHGEGVGAGRRAPLSFDGGGICGGKGWLGGTAHATVHRVTAAINGNSAIALRLRRPPNPWHYSGALVLHFTPTAVRRAVIRGYDATGKVVATVTVKPAAMGC